MIRIGGVCLVTIGVWCVIELAVQFGHYNHSCYLGEGEPPLPPRRPSSAFAGHCALLSLVIVRNTDSLTWSCRRWQVLVCVRAPFSDYPECEIGECLFVLCGPAEKCPTLTNMLVIIVGGIPIAMPTVLSVTLALGASKLAKVLAAHCAVHHRARSFGSVYL